MLAPFYLLIPRYHGILVLTSISFYARLKMMKQAKAMTIRLSSDQAEQLETVASVDGKPVSEVIRAAIGGHIEGRKKDKNFQASLKDRISRDQQFLKSKKK